MKTIQSSTPALNQYLVCSSMSVVPFGTMNISSLQVSLAVSKRIHPSIHILYSKVQCAFKVVALTPTVKDEYFKTNALIN